MSASSSTASAPSHVRPRLALLRAGLVLASVLALLGLVPLLDMGFDGSAWDAVLVVFAVLGVVVAVGTVVFAVLAWNGRRAPAIVVVALQALSVVPSLPAFFLPVAETTAEGPGPLLAVVGLAVTLAVVALVLLGLRRARRG